MGCLFCGYRNRERVRATDSQLLRLLPWRQGNTMYDGLPDKRLMLRVWLLVTCLEDMPQLAIQLALLIIAADTGGVLGVLAPLSILAFESRFGLAAERGVRDERWRRRERRRMDVGNLKLET